MNAPGVAHAAGLPVAKPGSRSAAADPAPSSLAFADVMQGRTALTDPQAMPGGHDAGSAPHALAFYQGQLLGKAVDLAPAHEQAEARAPLPERTLASRAGPGGTSPGAPAEPAAGVETKAVAPTAESAPVYGTAASADGQGPASPLGVEPSASGVVAGEAVQGNAAAPLVAGTAIRTAQQAPRSQPAKGADRASAQALRAQSVAQLSPVNLVVRAAATGVQVTARVGGLTGEDRDRLSEDITAALEETAFELIELRVNGEIVRSPKCK